MYAIGGVVVIPVFLAVLLFIGDWSGLAEIPLGFWVAVVTSFAYSVYLLVKET
jgi:hypothetical protein